MSAISGELSAISISFGFNVGSFNESPLISTVRLRAPFSVCTPNVFTGHNVVPSDLRNCPKASIVNSSCGVKTANESD
jgi:hypothetical protein